MFFFSLFSALVALAQVPTDAFHDLDRRGLLNYDGLERLWSEAEDMDIEEMGGFYLGVGVYRANARAPHGVVMRVHSVDDKAVPNLYVSGVTYDRSFFNEKAIVPLLCTLPLPECAVQSSRKPAVVTIGVCPTEIGHTRTIASRLEFRRNGPYILSTAIALGDAFVTDPLLRNFTVAKDTTIYFAVFVAPESM